MWWDLSLDNVKMVEEALIQLSKNLCAGEQEDVERPMPRPLYLNRLVSTKRLAPNEPPEPHLDYYGVSRERNN